MASNLLFAHLARLFDGTGKTKRGPNGGYVLDTAVSASERLDWSVSTCVHAVSDCGWRGRWRAVDSYFTAILHGDFSLARHAFSKRNSYTLCHTTRCFDAKRSRRVLSYTRRLSWASRKRSRRYRAGLNSNP